MKIISQKLTEEEGFIAMTSILMLSGFFIIMFVAMSFFATESLERSMAEESSIGALALSNSCVEIALNELKNNKNYSVVDKTETINGKSCTIKEVSSDADGYRAFIETRGEVDGHVKKTYVEVDIENWRDLEIIYWRESSF